MVSRASVHLCQPHFTCREVQRLKRPKGNCRCPSTTRGRSSNKTPSTSEVRLDRTLSYKQHLNNVRAKIAPRFSHISCLAGTTWGASARTLRTSTPALVFSPAKYWASVWCRSPHARKVDPVLNTALRNRTGCLKPTPVSCLPVLAGMVPAGL